MISLATLRRFGPYLAGIALAALLFVWIDHRGYARGVAHVEARDAKAAARINAAREKLIGQLSDVSGQLATAQQQQSQTFTEIRHVAGPIIYRSTGACLGSDAVSLLDRAAAAANGGDAGQSDAGATAAADVPAQR